MVLPSTTNGSRARRLRFPDSSLYRFRRRAHSDFGKASPSPRSYANPAGRKFTSTESSADRRQEHSPAEVSPSENLLRLTTVECPVSSTWRGRDSAPGSAGTVGV